MCRVDIKRYARCNDGRGTFNAMFFSDEPHDIARSKAICSRCAIKEQCLEGAILREESRGAHFREDFPNRDDVNWLAHSVVTKTSGGLELDKKPVTITIFEPKERKY